MRSDQVTAGQRVRVLTAFGTYVEKRAVTGVIDGEAFAVVRVCSDEEWDASRRAGVTPRGTPWPAEDVHPVDAAAAAAS